MSSSKLKRQRPEEDPVSSNLSEKEIEVETETLPKKPPTFRSLELPADQRFKLFRKYYPEAHEVKESDEMFERTRPINDDEFIEYIMYWDKLDECHEICVRKAIKDKLGYTMTILEEKELDLLICILKLKNFAILKNEKLNGREKNKIISNISELFVNNNFLKTQVLEALGLLKTNACHFADSQGKIIAPSEVKATHQVFQKGNNHHFIFGYPMLIPTFIPVVFCNQIFGQFLDIVYENKESAIFEEYLKFIDKNYLWSRLDNSCLSILNSFLSYKGEESDFVDMISKSLRELFWNKNVKSQYAVDPDGEYRCDLAILLDQKYPMFIFEAKNFTISMNTVFQGLQYYSLIDEASIDNNPVFLLTADRGLLNIYGVVKIDDRVICDNLLSFEFTACCTDIGANSRKLSRCLGAFYYLHHQMKARIKNIENDRIHAQHQNLSECLNNENMFNDTLSSDIPRILPAIFDVKKFNSDSDSGERIPIDYSSCSRLRPDVFIVKYENDREAVLKLTTEYSLEAHKILAEKNFAPKLLGYEKVYGNFHVVLMEYLKSDEWTLLNDIHRKREGINVKSLFDELKIIMDKIHTEHKIIHCDFRVGNIFFKKDQSGKYHFQFVDFELSGTAGTRLPTFIFRNRELNWPANFASDAPRSAGFDEHMFEQLKSEFKKYFEDHGESP